MYRCPEGRPQSTPPLEAVSAPPEPDRCPMTPQERGRRGGAALRDRLQNDPVFRARVLAERRRGQLKQLARKAAAKAAQEGDRKWYSVEELVAITGLSATGVRGLAEFYQWPTRRVKRGRWWRVELLGDPARLIRRRQPDKVTIREAPAELESPPIEVVGTIAPRSLWRRLFGWLLP